MIYGENEYQPHNYAVVPTSMVAYDTVNRALVPAPELAEWLKNNARGPWVMTPEKIEGISNPIIRFVDDRDPVLFKMWWS